MADPALEAAGEAWRKARRGANRVNVDLARAYADLAKAYEHAGQAGAETGEAISDAAHIAWQEAQVRAKEGLKPVRGAVGDHPLLAISAAAAIGALVGLALSRR